MYDKQLYEAYGYSLREDDEAFRSLQRDYEATPSLEGLLALNVARARAGLDVPVFDITYALMMKSGIAGLLRGAKTSIKGNFEKVEGEYLSSSGKVPVVALVHRSDNPHQVLRVSFGAHVLSILFDVHKADGNSAYFSNRAIPTNRVVQSEWYLSASRRSIHPSPLSEWLYSPRGLLKWLSKELDAFVRSNTSIMD